MRVWSLIRWMVESIRRLSYGEFAVMFIDWLRMYVRMYMYDCGEPSLFLNTTIGMTQSLVYLHGKALVLDSFVSSKWSVMICMDCSPNARKQLYSCHERSKRFVFLYSYFLRTIDVISGIPPFTIQGSVCS